MYTYNKIRKNGGERPNAFFNLPTTVRACDIVSPRCIRNTYALRVVAEFLLFVFLKKFCIIFVRENRQ